MKLIHAGNVCIGDPGPEVGALAVDFKTGYEKDLQKLIRNCTKDPMLDGIADHIILKVRRGEYIDNITERDKALFNRLNLPPWFPEYAQSIIALCHRSEMMNTGMKLIKEAWQRMQVER